MKKNLIMMAALLLVGAVSGYGAVQGWDIGSLNPTAVPAGWTTWDTGNAGTALTVGSSSTVGALTLTYTSGGLTNAVVNAVLATNETAAPLLAANDGVLRDHATMPQDTTNKFTLSGLTAGKTYKIQLTGLVTATPATQGTRNIKIVQGGITDYAIVPWPAGTNLFYSPIFTFTPGAGVTSTVVEVSKVKAGAGGISGVIVETLDAVVYVLTVNGGSGSGSYSNGVQVEIAANAPAPGQIFNRWTGDTQVVANVNSPNTTVTMSTNAVTLTATYTNSAVYYLLTGSAGAHGSITPASTNVLSGYSANFVITADSGYRIASLTTNGTSVTGMYFNNTSTNAVFTWMNVRSAGTLAATFTAQSTNQRPNLLFIMTDQQRWDALSIAGNTVLSTPNMDRIGKEGAYFKNFYSTRPVCVPARASILTGRSPCNTGIYGNEDLGIAPNVNGTSFDQILHLLGYYTRYFGKYHTPTNLLWEGPKPVYDNPDIGNHDHNVLLIQKDPGQTNTESSVFLQFLSGTDPLGLNTNPVPRSAVADPAHNLYVDNGYQAQYEALPLDHDRGGVSDTGQSGEYGKILVPAEYSDVAFVAKATLQALDDAVKTNKPFSITCSIGPPHPPMIPPDPWFSMYPATSMPVPATIGDSYINQTYKGESPGYNDPATIGQMIQCYYGMVADADHWVGKILDHLDELGLTSNTLVVFVSDHGEMLGDHGMNSKSKLLEGAAHIPGMFRFPAAIPAGTVVKAPAAHIDLFPTILDYLGVSAPGYKVDGYSLRPLINGAAGSGAHPDYCVSEERLYTANITVGGGTNGVRSNNKPMYAVRTEQWKLIVGEDATSTVQDGLYDMVNDPGEMNNLIGSAAGQSKYRDLAESMKARLIDYLTHINSPELTNIQARVVVPALPKNEGALDWSTGNTVVSNSELQLVDVAAGGNTTTATIDGRDCRAKTTPATDEFFYFRANPTLFYRAPGAKVAVECDFYVTAPTSIRLSYDSVKGPVDHPIQVAADAVGQWQTARWYIDDALFSEQMSSGTDFSIRLPAGITGYISRVKLVLPDSADWPPFTNNGTKLQWPETSDALGWKLYSTDALSSPASWSNVTGGIMATNGNKQYTVPSGAPKVFFRMQRP